MRTILFFDDWLVQECRGIARSWFRAEPWPGLEPATDPLLQLSYNSPDVLYDREAGTWRMWAAGMLDTSRGDEGSGLWHYLSDDGLRWRPDSRKPLVDRRATERASHLVFSGEYACCGGSPFLDAADPDPNRRYKMVYSDLSPDPVAPGGCRTAVSPDGIRWTIDRDATWNRQHTDTKMSILYNPYTAKYQFTCRPILGDRRVALYQTKDFRLYEKPIVIVHPDPMDPPGLELYGMPQFRYGEHIVGFLWKQHGSYNDTTIAARFKGRVDAELAYSVNGIQWNRTSRRSFLPESSTGSFGSRSQYPSCMVLDDEGWIRIYTTTGIGEHNDWHRAEDKSILSRLTVSRLRKDGFCALESETDVGHLSLRPLISRGGPITINAVTSRFGSIRAELRMVPDNKPIPGYELGESIPVRGDGHDFTLRWKSRSDIGAFTGEPFRLYLELDQARLYAIRVNADYLFSWVPQTNLAGDYVPGVLPGTKPGREKAYAGIDTQPGG